MAKILKACLNFSILIRQLENFQISKLLCLSNHASKLSIGLTKGRPEFVKFGRAEKWTILNFFPCFVILFMVFAALNLEFTPTIGRTQVESAHAVKTVALFGVCFNSSFRRCANSLSKSSLLS